MSAYSSMSKSELNEELALLYAKYEDIKKRGFNLDMSRGKPNPVQLDLSMDMLYEPPETLIHSLRGTDVRNYGELAGVDEAKQLFADLLGLEQKNIIMGGQSSLALMYDAFIWAYVLGVHGGKQPWCKQGNYKVLCPVPGYDRHFRVSQEFGAEMINIPMTPAGPDMELVRQYVENDPSVKAIWCVPKYSNPQGYTYSPETVEAFAALKPAADDFRIFWDNAYIVHGFRDEDDELVNIFDCCRKYGSEDMVYEFMSTSKITFSGAGVAVLAASEANVKHILAQMGVQTIGYDKINQIRHVHYLKSPEGIREHMKRQAVIMRPKFDTTAAVMDYNLAKLEIGTWTRPNGGYFICYTGLNGTAKRCISLCAEAGVRFTAAGAPFPYGIDPDDSTVRIAPSYPPIDELVIAMEVFCVCQRIAAAEVLLAKAE